MNKWKIDAASGESGFSVGMPDIEVQPALAKRITANRSAAMAWFQATILDRAAVAASVRLFEQLGRIKLGIIKLR